MPIQKQSMKEVLIRLRESDSEALLEIAELYAAVKEIASSAQRLTGTLREVAGEIGAIAGRPAAGSEARLERLAEFARGASNSVECQAAALRELQRGIEGWDIEAP